MQMLVREMEASELPIIVDYFHNATPEHLELLGVDPTRIPSRHAWLDLYRRDRERPIAERAAIQLIWLDGDRPIGFSTADKIRFGTCANMHLHVLSEADRRRGVGVDGVRQSCAIYFDRLALKQLFCEPNAFNVAPNRTLQRAGFRYEKTHRTVPGPLNFHQAVNRWRLDREM